MLEGDAWGKGVAADATLSGKMRIAFRAAGVE
jgi:hypothetical protein